MAKNKQYFNNNKANKKNSGSAKGKTCEPRAHDGNSEDNKKDNLIFTYSAIEQKRHHIVSPGKCLVYYLGIFPFVPLGLNMYSIGVHKLESRVYRALLFMAATFVAVIMFTEILMWINRIFYVYLIDERGGLYRLRISNFWYKIKNQTYLLNPMGNSGGRLFRMYYMLIGIKRVLENISDTVTYDELIAMGKLWKFEDVSDVVVKKKSISFKARIINKSNVHDKGQKHWGSHGKKKVRISRVYENDSRMISFLQHKDYNESEKMSEIIQEIIQADTPFKKTVRFTLVWTSLMAWAAVILLSGDFAKAAGIRSGEYVLTSMADGEENEKKAYVSVNDAEDYFFVADYGRLYRPILVLYGFVELIYLVSKGTDFLIAMAKKEE